MENHKISFQEIYADEYDARDQKKCLYGIVTQYSKQTSTI